MMKFKGENSIKIEWIVKAKKREVQEDKERKKTNNFLQV